MQRHYAHAVDAVWQAVMPPVSAMVSGRCYPLPPFGVVRSLRVAQGRLFADAQDDKRGSVGAGDVGQEREGASRVGKWRPWTGDADRDVAASCRSFGVRGFAQKVRL